MSAMPSNHQSGKTHLHDLPPELLISIFKAQASITDAVHLAATCHFLRNIYESEHTIAATVLQHEIPCYEKALELAKAQVPNPQPRRSDTLTKQIYLNAKDAARILGLASSKYLLTSPTNATSCPIHGDSGGFPDLRSILPHERTRILHSWYFLKLYVESLSASFDQERRQVLHQQLQEIGTLQSYVLWSMVVYVCEQMDDVVQEELGIADPDPPEELTCIYAYIQTPDWARTREAVTDVYSAKRNFGYDDFEEKLNGPCDVCPLPGGAACKPRGQGKELWDL